MFLTDIAAMHFGAAIIFATKFVLAWPVMFHLWNGFRCVFAYSSLSSCFLSYIYRHLAWDMGHGFKIPELYKTGWFVVGLSVVTALGLAAM